MASIVVVGAGLAGLACAWKLRRAGHEVEILEREGAALAGRASGFLLDRTTGSLRSGDRNLLLAAQVLGITWRTGPADSDAIGCRGRFAEAPAAGRRGLLAEPGGFRRRRWRWAWQAFGPGPDPWRPSTAAALDAGSFAEALTHALGDDPLARRLADAAVLEGAGRAEVLSSAAGLLALRRRAAGPRPVFLDGGLPALRGRLAAGATVRRGCEVTAVETESAGARVRYRTQGRVRSVLADAAVVAVPGPEVLRVCAKLSPEERGFFEQVVQAPELVAHVLLDAPPVRLPWLRVGFADEGPLHRLVSAHRALGGAPPGRGLLVVTLAAEASRAVLGAADAEAGEAVLAALADTPVGRVRPLELVVERRPAGRLELPVGAVARLAHFERRMDRSPRLAFAGPALLAPGPEAAFTSGLRAATELARGLGR